MIVTLGEPSRSFARLKMRVSRSRLEIAVPTVFPFKRCYVLVELADGECRIRLLELSRGQKTLREYFECPIKHVGAALYADGRSHALTMLNKCSTGLQLARNLANALEMEI